MKKIGMLVITAAMLMILVYQGSMAFLHSETELNTKISAGNLGIQLIENIQTSNVQKAEKGYHITSMPGAEIKDEVYIKNVKDHSLYVRVTASKHWEDADGNKLVDADASLITLQSENANDWIIIDDAENSNHELVYFYYKKPLNADESSSHMIDKIMINKNLKDQAYSKYRIKLNFEAEAIQSIAGKEAALAEWGIEMNTDKDGNIVSIED